MCLLSRLCTVLRRKVMPCPFRSRVWQSFFAWQWSLLITWVAVFFSKCVNSLPVWFYFNILKLWWTGHFHLMTVLGQWSRGGAIISTLYGGAMTNTMDHLYGGCMFAYKSMHWCITFTFSKCSLTSRGIAVSSLLSLSVGIHVEALLYHTYFL